MAAPVTPQTSTTPAPVRTDLPTWSCKVETAPKDQNGFTVGEVFEVSCSGTSVTLQPPLKVELTEKEMYKLVFLHPVEVKENQVRYLATSYRPGNSKMEKVAVVDAQGKGYLIDSIHFNVQSVIDPQKPPEQPFGPMGPANMAWPSWVFIAPVVVLAVLILWLALFLRRRLQKQKLEKNIKKFQSPLGSYHQFSKDLRTLKRGVVFSEHHEWPVGQVETFLNQLNEYFRLFLLREFIVPATTWPAKSVIKTIKKKDPHGYEKYRNLLQKAFKELDRASTNADKIKSKDCEQLSQICWQAVDLIWKTKRASGGPQ